MANSYTIRKVSSSIIMKENVLAPSRDLKWIIIGILAVAFVIGFGFFQNYRHTKYYQSFSESIIIGNHTDAFINLEYFDSVFYHKYYKFNTEDSRSLPTAEDRRLFAIELIEILKHFANDEHLNALIKLKTLRHDAEKVTAGAPRSREQIQRIMQRRLKRIIDNYKLYRRNEILMPFVVKDNNNRMYQQSILSMDLANEFGSLMGLAPEGVSSFSDTANFYSGGILKGLPVLKRLPDNIRDLKHLKKELTIAGGQVSIRSTDNTQALFLKRLKDLRKKCSVFKNQIVNLSTKNVEMSNDLVVYKKDYYATKTLTENEIRQFLLTFVEPERKITASDFLPF